MALTFRNPRDGRSFASWLDVTKGKSGVYVFRSWGTVEYIGESHSDQLYKTITRHFWRWPDPSRAARHYVVDEFFAVELAVVVLPKSHVVTKQNALIKRLKPTRNPQVNPDDDVVPF